MIFLVNATTITIINRRRSTPLYRRRPDFRLSCGRPRRRPVDRRCSRTRRYRTTPAQPLLDHPSRRRCQLIATTIRSVPAASAVLALDRRPRCHSLPGKLLLFMRQVSKRCRSHVSSKNISPKLNERTRQQQA